MILLAAGLIVIVFAGVASLRFRHSAASMQRVFVIALLTGCALCLIAGLRVLAGRPATEVQLNAGMPGGAWVFGIDRLSALFVVIISFVGGCTGAYGVSYLHVPGNENREGWSHFFFACLVVSLIGVVTARAAIPFLLTWELMALAAYALIVFENEDTQIRRAGLLYLVTTHTATLVLFTLFAVWASASSDLTFAAFAAARPSQRAVAAILLLSLLGFGLKAGLMPLHFWLPEAHAAAPSHVSAIMSGVVIKMGIYGLLRVIFLLARVPAWFGWLLLVCGITSGILGVLWALAQHDIKRLLAFHSVENIGIILMGMAAGCLGIAYDNLLVAVLGFAGAALHTLNHALFKSLLFLGAGAVYRATGTRNMEELGGLARRMPLTWLGFLIGAAAIVGLPPFNGFVSEWIVYQGLFSTSQSSDTLRLAVLGIPALALIGALALACFTKVAGVVFLGTPRAAHAARAIEVGRGRYLPALALAVTCLALGVAPVAGIAFVSSVARELSGVEGGAVSATVISGASAISLMALATLAVSAVLWLLRRASLRGQIVRHEPTWGCAYDTSTPRMQYTASSFAAPLLSVFGPLSGIQVERSAGSVRTHAVDLVLDGVALPLWSWMQRRVDRLRALQQGRLHLYLLYVMAALLVMLGYLALGPRP